jgi:hypothetical protein
MARRRPTTTQKKQFSRFDRSRRPPVNEKRDRCLSAIEQAAIVLDENSSVPIPPELATGWLETLDEALGTLNLFQRQLREASAARAAVALPPPPPPPATFEFLAQRMKASAAYSVPVMLFGGGDASGETVPVPAEHRDDVARRNLAADMAHAARSAERRDPEMTDLHRGAQRAIRDVRAVQATGHRPPAPYFADDVAALVEAALREAPGKGLRAAEERTATALKVGVRLVQQYRAESKRKK